MNQPSSEYYRNGEDLHFKMTTHEEERELFRKAKAGDADARELLIRNHLLFVAKFGSRRAKGRLPNDEVISAMNTALMTAIDRFNPDYKNRFRRFLIPFLQGAMSNLWSSRNPVRIPQGFRDPNFEGTSQQFVAFPSVLNGSDRQDDKELGVDHMLARITDTDGDPLTADKAAGPDELAGDSSRTEYLIEALKKIRSNLTERENQIIDMMYVEGLNMAKVGVKLGISRERVRQIHDVCLAKLRDSLPKSFPDELSGS